MMIVVLVVFCVACFVIARVFNVLFSFEYGKYVTIHEFKIGDQKCPYNINNNLIEVRLKNRFETRTYRWHPEFQIWVDMRGGTLSNSRVYILKRNLDANAMNVQKEAQRLQATKELWDDTNCLDKDDI